MALKTDRTNYLRKFHPFPYGDILVSFEWLGLVKLDRNSNVLWSKFNRAHHDFWIGENGRIYCLTAKSKAVTHNGRTRRRVVDFISILKPDGTTVRKISLLEAIRNSNYSSILDLSNPENKRSSTRTR
ncbi:MAG: aryl-sulfate sulfotransferase [bacterium]